VIKRKRRICVRIDRKIVIWCSDIPNLIHALWYCRKSEVLNSTHYRHILPHLGVLNFTHSDSLEWAGIAAMHIWTHSQHQIGGSQTISTASLIRRVTQSTILVLYYNSENGMIGRQLTEVISGIPICFIRCCTFRVEVDGSHDMQWMGEKGVDDREWVVQKVRGHSRVVQDFGKGLRDPSELCIYCNWNIWDGVNGDAIRVLCKTAVIMVLAVLVASTCMRNN